MTSSAGLLLLACGFAALTGCAPIVYTGPAPPGTTIRPLAALDAATSVIWHPSGQSLDASQKGLIRFDLPDKQRHRIAPEAPDRLAWSPDGRRQATATAQQDKTRVVLRDSDHRFLAEIILPGTPDSLFWPEDDGLVVITVRLKNYSFGADLSFDLTRWDGLTAPQTKVLHNATIKPATALALQRGQIAGSQATLSPGQDEIVYLRLHDPPAFQGGYHLVLHHLDTGIETEIAKLPLATRTVQFIDSDRILIDGGSHSLELRLWSDAKTISWPYPGRIIAVSPAGTYWLLDGHLLHNGEEIGHFPDVRQALFSPDGQRLLIKIGPTWHLLDGLNEPPPPTLPDADRKKLRRLRNWRSRGLITPQDYLQQKEGMVSP